MSEARGTSRLIRVLGEGVAIVVSILIAFGIDAWWGARQDREQERADLANLRAEFGFNLAELDRLAEWHVITAESARRLLALSRADSLDPNPLAMDSLVLNTLILPGSYNPRQGAVTALLASGDLSLLRDPELRTLLGSWSGVLDDLTEDETALWGDIQERWTPAVQERIPLDHVYALDLGEVSEAPRPDYRDILGDLVLENFMLSRIDQVQALQEGYGNLRRLVEEILEAVDRNLDGAPAAGGDSAGHDSTLE